MSDASSQPAPTPTEAALSLARLESISADVRGAVIIGSEGPALAASGDAEEWTQAARQVLAAADAAAGEPVSHAHVGTEDGEVFAVRDGDFALVAAAERFTLASLVFADIRAVLRELLHGVEIVVHREPAATGVTA